MSKKVINVALLGLGTVGTGVYKVLKMQQDDMEDKIGARAEIKKILVRNCYRGHGRNRASQDLYAGGLKGRKTCGDGK